LKNFFFHKLGHRKQYIITVVLILAVGLIGLLIHNLVGYRVVAFMLLVTVSILAMFLDIVPVLAAALLSALIWDFFFIPPRFTLTVGTPKTVFYYSCTSLSP
jgi:two-component system sensor histidine kinase KdpD